MRINVGDWFSIKCRFSFKGEYVGGVGGYDGCLGIMKVRMGVDRVVYVFGLFV